MAMPWEASVQARRGAPLHVQLELTSVPAECLAPSDEITIVGRVVQIFRGHELVEPGDLLRFPLWVCKRGDEPTGPAYAYHDSLLISTHIEAYFFGKPPECRIGAYEFVLLNEASSEPHLSMDDLVRDASPRRLDSKKWWQVWTRWTH